MPGPRHPQTTGFGSGRGATEWRSSPGLTSLSYRRPRPISSWEAIPDTPVSWSSGMARSLPPNARRTAGDELGRRASNGPWWREYRVQHGGESGAGGVRGPALGASGVRAHHRGHSGVADDPPRRRRTDWSGAVGGGDDRSGRGARLVGNPRLLGPVLCPRAVSRADPAAPETGASPGATPREPWRIGRRPSVAGGGDRRRDRRRVRYGALRLSQERPGPGRDLGNRYRTRHRRRARLPDRRGTCRS